ncbi:MAG TPA: hypothetical protein PK177_14315 [Burkholderiaceae bacterium]|nr:hypothetical protein [Burkholderiaceae bacterium]
MAHVRKQIRDAVIARLVGATAAGARVSANRTIAPALSQCPFIVVEVSRTSVDPATMGSALMRELSVDVVIHVAQSSNAADALDAIAVQVEQALDVDLPVIVSDLVLTGDEIDEERAGPGEIAALRMQYLVTVVTDGPETILEVV